MTIVRQARPVPPLALRPEEAALAEFCAELGVGTVVIDSLKDLAVDLARDETGGRVSAALAQTIASGVEVLVLHHQRKATGDNKTPKTLADVYGSTWITSGAGSVVLLWGDPGDIIVELRHLKQPAEDIVPLKVIHDHSIGCPHLHEPVDLEQLLMTAGKDGVEVATAAAALFGTSPPKPNEIEKARRRLGKLVDAGKAMHVQNLTGEPGRYVIAGGRVAP